MSNPIGELNPPPRLMMTPGPCSIDPRVYRALASPIVGHLDPWFRVCMEETQTLMRQIFQTENRITFPLSASGSGGIEASVLNSLEPGDEAICCVNGLFSERMYVIAQHTPAKIHIAQVPYGKPNDPEEVRKIAKGRSIKPSKGDVDASSARGDWASSAARSSRGAGIADSPRRRSLQIDGAAPRGPTGLGCTHQRLDPPLRDACHGAGAELGRNSQRRRNGPLT